MAPADDLKAHATSSQDFYALLDISPAAAENEIRRAYRRTALKYHPDKISNPTPADIEKFHTLQIAYDVLSDPTVRQLYDNAREARERKKREFEMMDAAKRKMKEDLEARERAGDKAAQQRGVKRTWMMSTSAADNEAEEKLEREIQRIAENSQRRRREAEEKLMREAEEEERSAAKEQTEVQDRSSQRVDRSKEGGGTNVPELERAVKVRWIREGPGEAFDKEKLVAFFTRFGKVENAFTLKDKKVRLGDKKKRIVATGVVVFTSIVSAHSAVLAGEKNAGQGDWAIFDSVFWASENGQDSQSPAHNGAGARDGSPLASPQPTSTPASSTGDNTINSKPAFDFASLKKNSGVPGMKKEAGKSSFTSFSNARSAASPIFGSFNRTKDQPLTTPSLEEVTLMRLKNAQREKERKALEEQIRRDDEAADAAAAAGGV